MRHFVWTAGCSRCCCIVHARILGWRQIESTGGASQP